MQSLLRKKELISSYSVLFDNIMVDSTKAENGRPPLALVMKTKIKLKFFWGIDRLLN